jgi:thiamine biosynthesis lipoprotein ApbE
MAAALGGFDIIGPVSEQEILSLAVVTSAHADALCSACPTFSSEEEETRRLRDKVMMLMLSKDGDLRRETEKSGRGRTVVQG